MRPPVRPRRFAARAVLLALTLSGVGVAIGSPAEATETADWLPFKDGSGVVEVGCTWNNGCGGGYHGYAGIDFITASGTNVYAAGPGTLVGYSGCDPDYSPGCNGSAGNYIDITHSDGRVSRYMHLSAIERGNGSVNRGDLIGKVGNSGGSPIPHLHYEETVNGAKVDPGAMQAVHGNSVVTYPGDLGYASWNDVPAWSDKFVWSDGFQLPDSDGDGVIDANDACPNASGPVSLNGCPDGDGDGIANVNDPCPTRYGLPNGCPVKSDLNQDGKADVAGFYRYDGNAVNLWTWNGQGRNSVSGPSAPWSGTGWDGSRIIPAGEGDFNDDGHQDIAAFFRHDNNMVDLNAWYGNGSGGLTQIRAWHVASGWDGSRIIPAGVGDFNGDGRTDIAAFFRHDNYLVDLRVWWGQSNGYFTEPTGPWSGNGWDGSRIIAGGAGDYDADGKLDIGTFYRHDGGMVDLNVWYGNGVGDFTLGRPWHVDSGWDASRFIPAGSADFNSDGKADLAVFFRHDNNVVDLRVWYGTSNRIMAANPGGPWSAYGWDGARIMPAGAGDYDGDGKADIATFFRHDNGMMDMNIWYGDGGGNLTLGRPWHVDTAWEGARLIPVA